GERYLLSVSALTSPVEQGIQAQLASIGYSPRAGVTVGASWAHAQVSDLLRTDTDPLSIGDEIRYESGILSVGASAVHGPAVLGLAIRRRTATVDNTSGVATSVDGGIVVDRPSRLPLRMAASTFLATVPGGQDRRTILGAVEGYLPSRYARGRFGLSGQREQTGEQELFLYVAAAPGSVDLRAGLARESSFGNTFLRMRLGLGVRYAHYSVAVAREEGSSGIGASYQFVLTTVAP
nr:hypothetical protein [Gemmatimonadaceae bacterium]